MSLYSRTITRMQKEPRKMDAMDHVLLSVQIRDYLRCKTSVRLCWESKTPAQWTMELEDPQTANRFRLQATAGGGVSFDHLVECINQNIRKTRRG